MKKILCVLLVSAAAGMVWADDLFPPDWRGAPDSTFAQWEFLTPEEYPAPDLSDNPFGGARLMVYPTHPWQDAWGGREGVWALSGLIDLEIDNNPELNIFKYLQIQLTWAGQYDSGAAVPTLDIDAQLVTGAGADVIQLLSEETIDLEPTGVQGADPYWHHTTYLYAIYPNPAIEFIDIAGSIWVDELVVDTICLPEPVTLALLGFGAVLLRKRK